MRKLLNTLYIMTPGSYLCREGETALVKNGEETKLRVPIHTLGGIVCFGNVLCSPPLMYLCAEHGVAISFLSDQGRFLARVQGPVSGNVLLRREQYRRADDPRGSTAVARAMVIGKISNGRTVLLRGARENPDPAPAARLSSAAERMGFLLVRIKDESAPEIVRGREGEAANIYFSVFDDLITSQKEAFRFSGRNRRPPLDNVNAILSFLYTLLVHDVRSALEGVGLDPAVGFLHRDRPGRPSLALDIMEELRPLMGDRLALSLINRQQVKPRGMKKTESGAVVMDDETRKEVVVAYQKRKQEEIQHPFINEKIQIGLLPHVQSMLLARHLRGDLDGYPVFLWK